MSHRGLYEALVKEAKLSVVSSVDEITRVIAETEVPSSKIEAGMGALEKLSSEQFDGETGAKGTQVLFSFLFFAIVEFSLLLFFSGE